MTGPHHTARQGAFPTTRQTLLQAAGSGDPARRRWAVEQVAAAYWRPLYRYLRLRRGHDRAEAEDLVQEVLLRLVQADELSRYDPARARFRTWLRVVADGVSGHAREAAGRIKRGGHATIVPLEFEDAEGEVRHLEAAARAGEGHAAHRPAIDGDAESWFEREWVRELFGHAVETLRAECARLGRMTHFEVFRRYDLQDAAAGRPTCAALGAELGLSETQVGNHLAWARARFRHGVLERMRALAGSEEFRADVRRLLGPGPLP
jgi:RNA polymerase sigma factor (sigma-70 family)